MAAPRIYPLGDAALVVDFGGGISEATLARVQALREYLLAHPLVGLRETVPAYTTLTVYYDPWLVRQAAPAPPAEQVAAGLRAALLAAVAAPAASAEVLEIPVCYGGEYGPDLAAVAHHTGLTEAEVVARHMAPTYRVFMLGFLPGFAYLGGLDAALATPRRATPRALVPAGAVGIAGVQTGIYPLASPGGWQLIGRTPRQLFDPEREPPTLLHASQHLRFVPISASDFQHLNEYEH